MKRIRLIQIVAILLFGFVSGIAKADGKPNITSQRVQAGQILNATGVKGGLIVHLG